MQLRPHYLQLEPHCLQPAHNTKFETTLSATINRERGSKENARILYCCQVS